MPTVKVDDFDLYWAGWLRPEGGVVVLVHGAGGNHSHWLPQISHLRSLAAWSVVAFDLPGHGRSGGEARSTIPSYADVVFRGLQALLAEGDGEGYSAIERRQVVVGGHSMGGAIALEMGLSRPGSLAGLILVGTGARLRVLPSALEMMARGERDETLLRMAYAPGAAPELLERGRAEYMAVPVEVLHRDYSACDRFDRMQEVVGLRLPALVVVGAEDALTPPKYARYLAEKLGGSLRIIPGAGHMVMLERPEPVNRAMVEFLISLKT
ncbi:MAG: alpha/beta hydrolase [Bacillota bacterium]